jgi:hypothetical protein
MVSKPRFYGGFNRLFVLKVFLTKGVYKAGFVECGKGGTMKCVRRKGLLLDG